MCVFSDASCVTFQFHASRRKCSPFTSFPTVLIEFWKTDTTHRYYEPRRCLHRLRETCARHMTVNPFISDARCVTICRLLVGPGPEPVQLTDDVILCQAGGRGDRNDRRVLGQVYTHLDPVTGHPLAPSNRTAAVARPLPLLDEF